MSGLSIGVPVVLVIIAGGAFGACSDASGDDVQSSAGSGGASPQRAQSASSGSLAGASGVAPPPLGGNRSPTLGTGTAAANSGTAGQAVAGRAGAEQAGASGQAGAGQAGSAGQVSTAGTGEAGTGIPANVGGAGGAAGASSAACDPADKTGAPEVIEFDATEYLLFGNGAKNYEPSAVTGKDTPNTGPLEPLIEVYPDFKDFTVYRPKTTDRLMPIIVWGNGGCAQHGTFHGEFLKELASYGFLIVADGAPGPKDSIGFDGPTSPADGTQQKKMLDWAFSENERACSIFFHKLDTAKVSVAGNSCGGLMTMYAAPDPRVTTAVLFNSGLFSRDQALYDSLHAPMAIFDGGPDDPATENARADIAAINNVPILFANDKRGHGSYLWDDNASEAGKVGVAWFRWLLFGEKGPTGKGMFVDDTCGICSKKDVWPEVMWKNQQLLKD